MPQHFYHQSGFQMFEATCKFCLEGLFLGLVSVIFVLLQVENKKENKKNAQNTINLIHCRYTSKWQINHDIYDKREIH